MRWWLCVRRNLGFRGSVRLLNRRRETAVFGLSIIKVNHVREKSRKGIHDVTEIIFDGRFLIHEQDRESDLEDPRQPLCNTLTSTVHQIYSGRGPLCDFWDKALKSD
jgi:hypothetical protein